MQYGPRHAQYEELLGTADYSLVAHGRHDLFTFCMCAGGYIMPSVSRAGLLLHQRHEPVEARFAVRQQRAGRDRARWRSSGGTDVLAGVRLQEQYEKTGVRDGGRGEYRCPGSAGGGLSSVNRAFGHPSRFAATRGASPPCDLREVLPPVVAEAVAHGLAADGPPLARPVPAGRGAGRAGSRGSSPVRIDRDLRAASRPALPGLYPVGEGAGYAGGIVSAAVDGLRTARAIIAKYALS